KGRFPQDEVEARMARFHGTTNMEDLGEVDMVIEAVFENMDLKREIFGKLDKIMKKGGVYTVGFAVHDDNITTRGHHVSWPMTVGIGAKADIEAVTLK
ncbi:MAG: hypothetical protein HN719_00530, partial [Alphaproteobacteria bacterium]|nr:hypothetical protein [Alphaproteobacteria bacterium]